ncbi:hypothetical protein Pan44_10020 [Caulifigura coniformis]|uniref:Uncharacterized protein n=1 Tax=Caulifigura coniformis TaxID=2527983 RepID=A0A517SA42_9PLAN|nr:hypothetical protein Pan44_10020 [Caulifigura coniformis]
MTGNGQVEQVSVVSTRKPLRPRCRLTRCFLCRQTALTGDSGRAKFRADQPESFLAIRIKGLPPAERDPPPLDRQTLPIFARNRIVATP